MKRCMKWMIFIYVLMLVFWSGYNGLYAQDAKKETLKAESIEQLTALIETALKENDLKKLEEIKKSNLEWVRGNLLITTQQCNKLMDEAVKNGLSGQNEKEQLNFKIARVMAEIYLQAYRNTYLVDKLDLFRRWGKKEKEKYLEAGKLYSQGEEEQKKYNYEAAGQAYNRGLVLYREIGYREGEADVLNGIGRVRKILSENEKAQESCEQGLLIYREIKNRSGEANMVQILGDVYLMLAENEKARESYEQGLLIYREIRDRSNEANTLLSLGQVYQMFSEYEKAREIYERGLLIYREIKDRSGEANALLSLGDVYLVFSENEKAWQSYERGLLIYREIKDRLGEANALQSLGNVHVSISEYEKARERYEQGLAIYREIRVKFGEAVTLLGLGDVHRLLNEYEDARANYEQGLVIFREIKARLCEANALQSLGDVHMQLSENEKARERYEQGLLIYREIKHRLGEANALQSLGDVHMRISENEKAREFYEQCLTIQREIKDRLGEVNTIIRIGAVYQMLSENEKARESFEQGLAIYREINHRLGEAEILLKLGNAHLILSENEKGRECFDQGLAIYREIKSRLGEAEALQGLGDVKFQLSEFENARRFYEEALSLQQEIGEKYGIGWSYCRLGQIFEAMKNFLSAEKALTKSIEIYEEIWREMKREEFKSPYFTSTIFLYENLIDLLFKEGKSTLAFSYAERSKARSFLYLLGNKHIDVKKGVPLNLVQQEEKLRQKIANQTQKIMENEEQEPARRSSSAQLNHELLQLKQSHTDLLGKIKFLCPEYANMISVDPLSLNDIQTLIRKAGNTVFLEYYTAPNATYLWLLDGKKILSYKININSQTLQNKIKEYHSMIANPETFSVETLGVKAQELYNLLLKPAQSHWKGIKRIGIIPHGALHYLPFEALMNNGKFLEEQDISFYYLPSASVYKYCREKNPLKKEQLIALGNPDGSLPFSESEVNELKSIFKEGAKTFTGKEATKSRVKSEGPSADILHFSCHGILDSVHPLYSALKLAADDKEAGNLEVQDIFQLEFKPAYLVTLSACETNLGSINAGDEIVVMSRAFIYAGTPSVVASMWSVDDRYTEKFMVNFYRELKTKDKIDALHSARKEMIQKEGKRHPYYWAPFVLIGDFR
ncbi:MAG: CHAT domain-containing protein [Candidatus Omnitrophota bacterium]